MGAPFSFVLRITALFVICIPCKIHLICLLDGPSYLNRMILRLSTKSGKLNIIPDTLSRLFNVEHSELRVAPHLAPICRNVPDNPALCGPSRSRPYQVNSHNLDEIQPVESYRERFTSATDVFMSTDPEKLRQAQQAEFGSYLEYLCDRKAIQCWSVCIRPFMPCFRCIAILHRTIGLRSYRSYSSLTIRLLARRCMKRRSS